MPVGEVLKGDSASVRGRKGSASARMVARATRSMGASVRPAAARAART
jgi:hypothetical protein